MILWFACRNLDSTDVAEAEPQSAEVPAAVPLSEMSSKALCSEDHLTAPAVHAGSAGDGRVAISLSYKEPALRVWMYDIM
jgi:hypothetical protein